MTSAPTATTKAVLTAARKALARLPETPKGIVRHATCGGVECEGGTCSSCGGNVVAHEIQYSVRPMPPTCQSCGATPKSPVLDMGPPAQGWRGQRGGPGDR